MAKKTVAVASDDPAAAAAATAAAASAALIVAKQPSQWKKTMGVSDLVVGQRRHTQRTETRVRRNGSSQENREGNDDCRRGGRSNGRRPAALRLILALPAVLCSSSLPLSPCPACIFNTSFVFLTLVDWSFDSWCLDALMRRGGLVTGASPEVVSLGTYYAWRIDAGPVLKYWNLFVTCLLPLIAFGLLSDNFATLRGRKAPLAKHLLDAESLLQLVSVLSLTIAKAMPTTETLLAIVAGKGAPDASPPLTVVRDLTNIHFLLFGLNALQFFVPFLLWNASKKQETMMAAEIAVIAADKAAQEKALEKALAAAEKNAAKSLAGPSLMEMEARMAASEATAVPDLRKRK